MVAKGTSKAEAERRPHDAPTNTPAAIGGFKAKDRFLLFRAYGDVGGCLAQLR